MPHICVTVGLQSDVVFPTQVLFSLAASLIATLIVLLTVPLTVTHHLTDCRTDCHSPPHSPSPTFCLTMLCHC